VVARLLGGLFKASGVVDPTIVARLFARKRRAGPLDELTEREREVLALVAEGLSNRPSPPACSSPSAPSRPTSSRSSSSPASAPTPALTGAC
jgi:hypothetical protein